MKDIVIVGAGQGAVSAAAALREGGFDGCIRMVGDEPELPYERPPLSKDYLLGKQTRAELAIKAPDWYAEAAVEPILGSPVTAIDVEDRAVELGDGQRLPYDRLLIATGGRPRRLPDDCDRVLYLRSVHDADRIRAQLPAVQHLVIVGAGFIGAARQLGKQVTMLELVDVPLARSLGTEIGMLYADIHRDQGVDLRTGVGVVSVAESADGTLTVHTTLGDQIDCDLVVAGLGIRPNTELAAAAGLDVEDGVVVDQQCMASAPDVYAAGDVARRHHPLFGRHVRAEHYDNAIRQGAACAATMLGGGRILDDPHWFWSDQYDYNLQYVGAADGWDEMVVRGSLDDRDFSAFYLREGVVQAALAINRPRDVLWAKKLVRSRTQVDVAKLRDDDVDLRMLTRAARAA